MAKVRNGLAQEIRPGTEVRVEDSDGFARCPREGVPEVSRLLQHRTVWPHNVCQGKTMSGRGGPGNDGKVSRRVERFQVLLPNMNDAAQEGRLHKFIAF